MDRQCGSILRYAPRKILPGVASGCEQTGSSVRSAVAEVQHAWMAGVEELENA